MYMRQFKASVPGSTMLLGEYAVLHQGWALVCAVDQRITVQLTPRTDNQIEIISSLGSYQAHMDQLEMAPPFQFVIAALKKYQHQITQGCTLTIESEFSEKIGLSSSAAVTVATVSVIAKWLQITYTSIELIQQVHHIIQHVQGIGSGADVAACVLGGVVAYRQQPFVAEKINWTHPLNLIYSGSKTTTAIAINQVNTRFAQHPTLYQHILRAIDECAQQGISAIKTGNNEILGQVMTIQQSLMQALGVNTPVLQGIINELVLMPTILGAKISGSGLGDSVISLGRLSEDYVPCFAERGTKQIPMAIASEGVHCE